MAEVTHGLRGTASYPANQRPGNFKGGIKMQGSRITREDVKKRLNQRKVSAAMVEVHKNIPSTVKATGKTGKAKEAMLRAVALSKVRQAQKKK